MRRLIFFLLLAFSGILSAEEQPIRLEDFNSSPPWDGTSEEVSDDPNLVSQFKEKDFICRNTAHFTPKESDAAARAFSEFVEYAITGDRLENFWMDAAHRQVREDLLSAALKAGSWKADYLDSVWAIRRPKDAQTEKEAYARLVKLVEKGIPIAVYKYATYLFGRNGSDMYDLLNAAIDRGSPHAMALVGTTIVVQSKALRPIGKALLECAVSQGHASAYNGLGILADMEGRRLEAYRLWEKGVNEGCVDCIPYMMNTAKVRNDPPGKSLEDLMPELVRIKKFYDEITFYEMSELPEFTPRLPTELAFHPDDAELLLLLKSERALRNQ